MPLNAEILREESEDLQMRLKAFCHAPECSRPHQCPRDHKECNPLLNVVTAMMWVASQDVTTFGCKNEECHTCALILARPSIYMQALELHSGYDNKVSDAYHLMQELEKFNNMQLKYRNDMTMEVVKRDNIVSTELPTS